MGGKGPGHKSPRARQARLINIQKARAARRFPGAAVSNPASSSNSSGSGGCLPRPDGPPSASPGFSASATPGSTNLRNASSLTPPAFAAATFPLHPPPSRSSSAPARKLSGAASADGFADPFTSAASVILSTTAQPAPRASPPKPASATHPVALQACLPIGRRAHSNPFPSTSSATFPPGLAVFSDVRIRWKPPTSVGEGGWPGLQKLIFRVPRPFVF